jgi:hypothetical protein
MLETAKILFRERIVLCNDDGLLGVFGMMSMSGREGPHGDMIEEAMGYR